VQSEFRRDSRDLKSGHSGLKQNGNVPQAFKMGGEMSVVGCHSRGECPISGTVTNMRIPGGVKCPLLPMSAAPVKTNNIDKQKAHFMR